MPTTIDSAVDAITDGATRVSSSVAEAADALRAAASDAVPRLVVVTITPWSTRTRRVPCGSTTWSPAGRPCAWRSLPPAHRRHPASSSSRESRRRDER